jgi:preprotein translocase subunit SecD
MAAPNKVRPGRTLLLLGLIILGLTVWAFWPGQSHTPKLGLDLQGGTQVTLVPKSAEGGGDVTQQQLDQAVEIIRQRIDGVGVAEAEVTTQGSGGSAAIIVSVPGQNQQGLEEQLSQTALLDFRPVLTEEATAVPNSEPTPGPVTTPSAAPSAKATPRKGQSAPMQATPKPAPTPKVMRPPIQASSNSPALQQAYAQLDCSDPKNREGGTPDNPEKWLVTCARDGSMKYLLQPAFIRGTQIDDAQAQLPQQGAGGWQVTLSFDADGSRKLAEVSTSLSKKQSPQNQFAIVLDGLVQSSPYFQGPILGGQAQINGNFSNQEAIDLANIL